MQTRPGSSIYGFMAQSSSINTLCCRTGALQPLARLTQLVLALPMRTLCALIKLYQVVSVWCLPKQCRFYPSCSHYALASLKKNGLRVGFWRSLVRILKCNPWHPGGLDYP
ncbi:MAG: membrane protein insertion efficiency factor YidD [Vampirovibrionales bacterium]|nr:membrane protein insertion efficiency factor YidD [Vampirovibrionales bacterium]